MAGDYAGLVAAIAEIEAVRHAFANGPRRELDKAAGAQARPSMQYAPPVRRDRRRSVGSATQSTCDGGDRVGVTAATHGGVER